jgi:hypothetical protein
MWQLYIGNDRMVTVKTKITMSQNHHFLVSSLRFIRTDNLFRTPGATETPGVECLVGIRPKAIGAARVVRDRVPRAPTQHLTLPGGGPCRVLGRRTVIDVARQVLCVAPTSRRRETSHRRGVDGLCVPPSAEPGEGPSPHSLQRNPPRV